MSDDLTTIASYRFLAEAETDKLELEGEGFTVFLADAEIVNMDWLLGNAVGDIKLQTPNEQAQAAAERLQLLRNERQARAATASVEKCLSCGAPLPADTAKCPVCGWSYAVSETAESPTEGAEPDSSS